MKIICARHPEVELKTETGYNTIQVVSCPKCIEIAYDEGYNTDE